MKKFAFRYSPLAFTLLIAVAVIFAASVAVNVYDIIRFSEDAVGNRIIAVTVILLSLSALTFTVAATVYGRYIVKGKYLYCRFGFLFVKTDIRDIFQLTEFTVQNKLVMYFKNEKYSVAVIKKESYQDFYAALKSVNPDIAYTVQSAD